MSLPSKYKKGQAQLTVQRGLMIDHIVVLTEVASVLNGNRQKYDRHCTPSVIPGLTRNPAVET
jgi:hypothetical protein